jgi:hypothetical protein
VAQGSIPCAATSRASPDPALTVPIRIVTGSSSALGRKRSVGTMSEISVAAPIPIANNDCRLLVSRDQAREMLGGISLTHLRRLMKVGDIAPVDLTVSTRPTRRGKLYFRVTDLSELVDKRQDRSVPK